MQLRKSDKKCKNCKGTGMVFGIRKRDKGKKKPLRKGRCYYCNGMGYTQIEDFDS